MRRGPRRRGGAFGDGFPNPASDRDRAPAARHPLTGSGVRCPAGELLEELGYEAPEEEVVDKFKDWMNRVSPEDFK